MLNDSTNNKAPSPYELLARSQSREEHIGKKDDTWVTWGYKWYNNSMIARGIWTAVKISSPSEVIKQVGPLVLMLTASWISEKTGYQWIKTCSGYSMRTIRCVSSPCEYTLSRFAQHAGNYVAKVVANYTDSRELKALAKVVCLELVNQGAARILNNTAKIKAILSEHIQNVCVLLKRVKERQELLNNPSYQKALRLLAKRKLPIRNPINNSIFLATTPKESKPNQPS